MCEKFDMMSTTNWVLSVCFFADKLSDNELRINKGVFVAICLIILLVGIAVGGVLCLLVYRKQRRNHKRSKIARMNFLSLLKLAVRICADTRTLFCNFCHYLHCQLWLENLHFSADKGKHLGTSNLLHNN